MTKTQLAGKTVMITGAGSGIGRAAAIQIAGKGARLVLTDVNAAGLQETVGLVKDADVIHHEAFDISDADAVTTFAGRALAIGPVDVIMNVAGISTWGRIQDLQAKHWRDTVEIDLMGPIHIMSAFVPAMIAAGNGGHVVNVSSAAGLFGLPIHAPYSAAKFGLRGVSEVLRFDLEQYDIGVTLVCPGAVRTPLVGTVNIVGVDRDHPTLKKAIGGFEKHAVSPESAAAAMIKGVEKGKYLVFTSSDIRLGWYGQRYIPFAYNRVMKIANKRFSRLLSKVSVSQDA
ncbi:MAG: short chain dehydrogenase [Aeromicrobium sp.]|nr:short chain dehydrogenase [Aeromicrobium sp.]